MRIELTSAWNGFSAGHEFEVLEVVPHGGNTDSERQYVTTGQYYVPSDYARVVEGSGPPMREVRELHVKLTADTSELVGKLQTGVGDVDALLAERGRTHGEYSEHAEVTQMTVELWRDSYETSAGGKRRWVQLPAEVRETLHMVAHKVGRVLTGDPLVDDHWDDVAGYARLVSQRGERLRGVRDNLARSDEALEEAQRSVDLYEHMALFWGVDRATARERVHAQLYRLHELPSEEELATLEDLRTGRVRVVPDLSDPDQLLMAGEMRMTHDTDEPLYRRNQRVGVRGHPERYEVEAVDRGVDGWRYTVGAWTSRGRSVLEGVREADLYAYRDTVPAPEGEEVGRQRYRRRLTTKEYLSLATQTVRWGSAAGAVVSALYGLPGHPELADVHLAPDEHAAMLPRYAEEYGA